MQATAGRPTPRPAWHARGAGKEARLCYARHLLAENRCGLISLRAHAGVRHSRVRGRLRLFERERRRYGRRRLAVGADKGHDSRDFVAGARKLRITPHVAARRRHGTIDWRTTRHSGYATSQRRSKLVEEPYG